MAKIWQRQILCALNDSTDRLFTNTARDVNLKRSIRTTSRENGPCGPRKGCSTLTFAQQQQSQRQGERLTWAKTGDVRDSLVVVKRVVRFSIHVGSRSHCVRERLGSLDTRVRGSGRRVRGRRSLLVLKAARRGGRYMEARAHPALPPARVTSLKPHTRRAASLELDKVSKRDCSQIKS